MSHQNLMYLVPIVAIIALLFAFYLTHIVIKEDEGTEKMKEIASAISEGAHAFLWSEYRVLIIFVIILFFCIGIGVGNFVTSILSLIHI